MALSALIAFTLACTSWSLWIRRATWRRQWEAATTIGVAMQGAGLALIHSPASAPMEYLLHAFTGEWNLEQYLGHVFYLVAISAVVYNAIERLDDARHTHKSFQLNVEFPLTLAIPLMLVTFSVGNGGNVYRANFFDVPADIWLDLYWTVTCGLWGHLLIYASRALLVLRRDPKSRRVATIYLCGSLSGIIACALRLISVYVPVLGTLDHGILFWGFACALGISFALGSGYSWLTKLKKLPRGRDQDPVTGA